MSDLIEPFTQYLRAGGQSEDTVRLRRVILRRCDRLLPHGLDYASTSDLIAFLAPYSGWTLCTVYTTLRVFFRWATAPDDPRLPRDPSAGLKPPRTPRSRPDPVTDDELAAALARSDDRWRTVVLLAVMAGLRAAEIAGLAREDVRRDLIVIRRAKGGDQQTVPTHEALWRWLSPLPSGRVVTNLRGQAVTGRYMSRAARRHFDRIGLPRVRLHRFRHRFATDLLLEGADLRTVQELLRHARLSSTEVYTLVTGPRRVAAVQALPDLTRDLGPAGMAA